MSIGIGMRIGNRRGGGPDPYAISMTVMQDVYDNAGVSAGTSPGLSGAVGVSGTPGGAEVIAITSKQEASVEADAISVHTDGNNIYIMDGRTISRNTAGYPFSWDDGDHAGDVYHIKFTNTRFDSGILDLANFVEVSTDTDAWLFLDRCDVDMTDGVSGTHFVELRQGNLEMTNIDIEETRAGGGGIVYKGHGSSDIVLDNIDMLTNGNANRMTLFYNDASGGSFTLNRLNLTNHTIGVGNLIRYDQPCRMTITKSVINTSAAADAENGLGQLLAINALVVNSSASVLFEDNQIRGGVDTIMGNHGTNQTVMSNVTLRRNEFYFNDGGSRMIEFGDNSGTTPSIIHDWLVEWNRFRFVPDGDFSPGNEVLYLDNMASCVIQYNWFDEAPEESIELVRHRSNNKVRYNGTGNPAGSQGTNGELVDIFLAASGSAWSGNECHDLWGHAGGNGVVLTNTSNWQISNILTKTDQQIYAAPSNVAQGNVQIHATGTGVCSANSVFGQISQDSDSHETTAYIETSSSGGTLQNNTDTAVRKAALIPS